MQKEISEDSSIIYGRNPVLEALEYEKEVEKIFILNSIKGHFEKQVRQYARDQLVPVAKVPQEKLNRLVGSKAHQGIVAILAPVKYMDLEALLQNNHQQEETRIILLDGVKDVRNIGAIARSALVFGIDGLVLSAKNCGQINADTVKASAGAILDVPLSRVQSTLSGVAILKEHGYTVVASNLQATMPLSKYKFPPKCALIIGSEEKGVDKNVLSEVHEQIIIPQQHTFDSLNVSVAAGIMLYEWTKLASTTD